MKKKILTKESLMNISTFAKKIWGDIVIFTKKNWKDIAIFAICLIISICWGYNLEKCLPYSESRYLYRFGNSILLDSVLCVFISLILNEIFGKISDRISAALSKITIDFAIIFVITFVVSIIIIMIDISIAMFT